MDKSRSASLPSEQRLGQMNAGQALHAADQTVRVVLEAVGQPVVSIVLHGSLVLSAYEPERSDIDLLFLFEVPLRDAEKHAIFEAVGELFAPTPTAIDLRVTSRLTAAMPERLPTIDLEIAAHPPDNALKIVADNATDPDLLYEFAICRAYGRTLHGRDAVDVIGDVPRKWLLEIADNELATLQRVHSTGRVGAMVPLTACRMWRHATEGVFCSKHEAARWAFQKAPECHVILEAISAHRGQRGSDLDASDLPPLLTRARDAVTKALAGYG